MPSTATESGTPSAAGRGALYAAGLTGILASTCCLGPLLLLTLGFSGAWIGTLTALEPFRPLFVGIAVVALFIAHRQIFRPAAACKPGESCAIPQVRVIYKTLFWVAAILVLIGVGYPFALPLFY